MMDSLKWLLQTAGGADALLLVAVSAPAADTPGAYPCRVVGRFSAGAANPLAGAAKTRGTETDAARVSRFLSEVGVPPNLLGCAYLRTALTLLLAEPSLGRTITRRLYPRIAEAHRTTVRGVERAIRNAIAQTFARAGDAGYRAALGRLASSVGDRPTNSEFLSQAAERLRMEAEIN